MILKTKKAQLSNEDMPQDFGGGGGENKEFKKKHTCKSVMV